MKRQDELRAQLTAMKAEAASLLEAKKLDEAKAKMSEMDGIKAQIELLDKLDSDFAGQASAVSGVSALQAGAKPIQAKPEADAVKKFAAAARTGFKALHQEAIDEDGGYVVPEDISTQIQKYKEAGFSLRSLVTSVPVKTNKGARTFKTKSTQTGFAKVAEGGKIGAKNTPTFERIAYEIDKYAGAFPVTSEVLADTDARLTGTLVEWIGDEGIATENKVILDLIATKTPIAMTGIDDIKKAINVTLGSAYAGSVRIVTNDDGLQYLDTLKDGMNRYLLSPDPREPMQMRLSVGARSVPITVVPNKVLATDATSGAIPFVIGDLKEAIILWDRQQLTIKMSDTATIGELNAFEDDLTLYRAVLRMDCTFKDEDAVVYGQITPSTTPPAGNSGN